MGLKTSDFPFWINPDELGATELHQVHSDGCSTLQSADARTVTNNGFGAHQADELLTSIKESLRTGDFEAAGKTIDLAETEARCWPREFQARLQIEKAWYLHYSGRLVEAKNLSFGLVEELRGSRLVREVGLCQIVLGATNMALGYLEDALRSLTVALHVFDWQLQEKLTAIRVLNLISIVHKRLGKYVLAEDTLMRAVEMAGETDNQVLRASSSINLAVLFLKQGNLHDAKTRLLTVLGGSIECAGPQRARARLALSQLYCWTGETALSREVLLLALRETRSQKNSRDSILVLEYLADLRIELGQHARALQILNRAIEKARAGFRGSDLICELQRRRAVTLDHVGSTAESRGAAVEALQVGEAIGEPFELALAKRSMGIVLQREGSLGEALAHFRTCESILRGLGEKFEWSRTLIQMAKCLANSGQIDEARFSFQEAERSFHHLGLEVWKHRCGAHLQDLDIVPTLRVQNTRLTFKGPSPETFGILSNDDRILRAFVSLTRVAQSKLPVLIEGESGTGKELFARALHGLSSRAKGPFLPLNCGAIPPDMQEAELFGHTRGAFTGAVNERVGYFESAHLGTLFLDEIGEMSLAAQTRLLRVLETDEFCRVGESRVRRLDVRYVAATNQILDDAVSQREFRLDLFQRLNGLRIQIPALRSRPQDVPLLFRHFLEQFRHEDRPMPVLSRSLMARLADYPWPGNVRELRRAVERAVILACDTNVFDEEHFPFLGTNPGDGLGNSLPDEIADMERGRLIEALEKTRWSKSGAARLLGMSRTTLNSKLQRHGIPLDVPERFRPPRG